MAHSNDASLGWDWDTSLLSNPTFLGPRLREAGGRVIGGFEDRLSATPPSAHRPHLGYDERHRDTNEASPSHTQADSVTSETRQIGSNGTDSRSECPNFLAGRVPCACTDNDDDDESGVSRKRSKPVPRCQVASCSADLTDLKGYHQRHRVCLRCAHATRVMLRDLPHRYCQQCGKFHPICDFDEGKRSCRRKLERHNNRRRRKANEEGFPSFDGDDLEVQNDSSPVHGTSNWAKYEGGGEGEPKVLSAQQPATGVERNLQALSSLDQSFPVEGSKTSVLQDDLSPEISLPAVEPTTTSKENARNLEPSSNWMDVSRQMEISLPALETLLAAPIEENVPHAEPSSSWIQISQQLEHQLHEGKSCCTTEQGPFNFREHQSSVHILCPEDFPLQMVSLSRGEGGSQIERGNDESLLALLLGESTPSADFESSENADEPHHISATIQPWGSSPSRESQNKQLSYLSPLPTGRISFKLYDWNPGDFPRPLRQQIMEWLANMPVDLEGYIRSGCTILTIFMAMPQSKWDELNADWAGSVLKLLQAELIDSKFWSCGYLTARMENCVVHFKNGDLVPERAGFYDPPVLDRVRPMCLELGREEEVVIFGQNIEQPSSRLVVSFGGKCFTNNTHHSCLKEVGRTSISEKGNNGIDEKLSVKVPALHSKSSGTAYIEVEHTGGTSNYIPVLVAEKEIVDEIRSLENEMDRPTSCCSQNIDATSGFPYLSQTRAHNLLLDLGWVLKDVSHRIHQDHQPEISELLTERLRRLLFFGIERSWWNVVERVLQLAKSGGLVEKIGILENGLTAVQAAVLYCNLSMVEHLIGCTESLCPGSKKKFWWSLEFPGPNGLTALHMMVLLPEALSRCGSLVMTEDMQCLWNSIQHQCNQTLQGHAIRAEELSGKINLSELAFQKDCMAKGENVIKVSREGQWLRKKSLEPEDLLLNLSIPNTSVKRHSRENYREVIHTFRKFWLSSLDHVYH